MGHSVDYERLQGIVRSTTMKRREAEDFAHHATREILDCRTGRLLCDELVETLARISASHSLEDGADALRDKAADLIRQIERISKGARPLLPLDLRQ
jgi:hypothetical protein